MHIARCLIPHLCALSLCAALFAEDAAPAKLATEEAATNTAPAAETPASLEEKTSQGSIEITPYSEERHSFIYYFEHRALPRLWFTYPEQMWGAFVEIGKEELQRIFDLLQEAFEVSYPDERAQLDLERIKLECGVEGWLVTFPKPEQTPEANFAALVFDGEQLRYIVGEYNDLTGPVIWFLCEWHFDYESGELGMHGNKGVRDIGTKDNFLSELNSLLAEEISLRSGVTPSEEAPQTQTPETSPDTPAP